MPKTIFFVHDVMNMRHPGQFTSLEEARSVRIPEFAPAFVVEHDPEKMISRYHSFWPQPSPAHIPDLTESVAYSICARSVEAKIYSSMLDISELAEKYASQPHEDVLQDHCRDLASEIYGADRYHFHAVVPANSARAQEMERAIVDELCGLVETVLARRLRELASTCQQAAEHLEQN